MTYEAEIKQDKYDDGEYLKKCLDCCHCYRSYRDESVIGCRRADKAKGCRFYSMSECRRRRAGAHNGANRRK